MMTTAPVQPRDAPTPSFASTLRRPGTMMPM
jgi:hypothetical protein